MRTVQVSLGELIEAMYDDLAETYEAGDVARAGAAAVANELLAQAASERAARQAAPPPAWLARQILNARLARAHHN
jgi:hypothetical protein